MSDDKPHGAAYRFLWLFAIACAGALLFFAVDVKHRVSGYRAVHGGIRGTVTIVHCGKDLLGGVSCTGHFRSDDGLVAHRGVTVNGGPQALHWRGGPVPANVQMSAAVPDARSGEAWTIDGTPWLNLSRTQSYTLVPLVAGVLIGWLVLRQGMDGVRRVRARRQRRELSYYRRMFTETPRSKRR